jgi:acyl-[acyl carrier protein]--UDP-N-acetylglucosamine O-acyltransferase
MFNKGDIVPVYMVTNRPKEVRAITMIGLRDLVDESRMKLISDGCVE